MQGTQNEWEPLRRRKRRMKVFSIGWLPLTALGVAIFWPHPFFPTAIMTAAWVLSLYSAALTPCPRCYEAFGVRPITYFRDGSWSGSNRRPWDNAPSANRGTGISHSYWRLGTRACVNCGLAAYGAYVREGADAEELPYDVPVPPSSVARFFTWSFPGAASLLGVAHVCLAFAVNAPLSEFARVCLGSLILAMALWTAGYANRAEWIAGLRFPGWAALPLAAAIAALLWQGRPDLARSYSVCVVAGWWARNAALSQA